MSYYVFLEPLYDSILSLNKNNNLLSMARNTVDIVGDAVVIKDHSRRIHCYHRPHVWMGKNNIEYIFEAFVV